MKRIAVIEHTPTPEPDSGVAHLLARGHDVAIVRPWLGEALPRPDAVDAVMLLGGPQMVTDRASLPWLQGEIDWIGDMIAADMPMFGICLGSQLLAHRLGGDVDWHPQGKRAFGYHPVAATGALDNPVPDGLVTLQGNAQGWTLPPGAELLATGHLFPNQAFRFGANVIAVQFHPEVTRPILDQWQAESPDWEDAPGTQNFADQLLGFRQHDAALKRWYAGFLDRWAG